MIRRILTVALPIILMIGIIMFVWWITDPNREKDKSIDKKIIELSMNEINSDVYGINNIYSIDNDNYICIMQKFAIDENGNPIKGVYTKDYSIFKYNTNIGVQQEKLELDTYFEVAGIDCNEKTIYLATTDSVIPEGSVESLYNIVKVNYETMQIKEILADKTDFYGCRIFSDAKVWMYLVNGSLYASEPNFKNERLLLSKNEMNNCFIVEMTQNKIIYELYNTMENGGIGIIDIYGNNKFIPLENARFQVYNTETNEIYYTDSNALMKINVDTLEKVILLNNVDKMISNTYISDDMKYVAIIEEEFVEGILDRKILVYDLEKMKLLSEYDLENDENVMSLKFVGNSIILIQNGKLYKWNYLK